MGGQRRPESGGGEALGALLDDEGLGWGGGWVLFPCPQVLPRGECRSRCWGRKGTVMQSPCTIPIQPVALDAEGCLSWDPLLLGLPMGVTLRRREPQGEVGAFPPPPFLFWAQLFPWHLPWPLS